MKDWHIGGSHQETKNTGKGKLSCQSRSGWPANRVDESVKIDLAGTHGAAGTCVYHYLPKEMAYTEYMYIVMLYNVKIIIQSKSDHNVYMYTEIAYTEYDAVKYEGRHPT